MYYVSIEIITLMNPKILTRYEKTTNQEWKSVHRS